MQLQSIPRTGVFVSPICLGTMTFGNPVDRDNAIRLVHAALDNGINFIDTADMYEGYDRHLGSPGGVSEKFLGEALRDRRDQAGIYASGESDQSFFESCFLEIVPGSQYESFVHLLLGAC